MSHYSPIFATLVTLLLAAIILISKFGKKLPDIPIERSLHATPIPRISGVGRMAGIYAGWALMLASLVWWVELSSGMVALSTLSQVFLWPTLLARAAIFTALMLLLDVAWIRFEREQHA